MKRTFEVVYPEAAQLGYVPGDEAAHRAAAALADRATAPTIGALIDMLTFLERVGGQFHVTALRLQAEGQEDWDTYGLDFAYETRDARLIIAAGPTEIAGVPVNDSEGPGTVVELEAEEEASPDAEPLPKIDDELEPVALSE